MVLFLFAFMSLLVASVTSLAECHDAYSCALAYISTSRIECYGYHSCHQASLQTTSTIWCIGGYSCFGATRVYSSDGSVQCYGLGSCAMIESIGNINEPLYCGAQLACYQSNIHAQSIWCAAERSCANSIAYIERYVWIYGYLGAQNSTFYSTDSSSDYYFYGPYSGNNATIICGNNHTCSVHCYNNGCNILSLVCNGTCNFVISCDDEAEKSDVCPNGIIMNSTTNFIFLPQVTLSSFAEIYTNYVTTPCYTPITNAIHCDDNKECAYSTSLDTSDIHAPICCASYRACASVNNITSIIPLNSSVINSVAIRCDGYASCLYSDHIHAVNGGNIYMSGLLAGRDIDMIEITQNYDIFCTAYNSCRGSTLKNSNNTYCITYLACQYTFIVNVSTVWMYGQSAGLYSYITGLKDNLYCAGEYSCMNATVSSGGDMIQASGYQVLYMSILVANDNCNVWAVGYQALYFANITKAEKVCQNPQLHGNL